MTLDRLMSDSANTAVSSAGPKKEDPEQVRKAARDFEALLIGQLLKMTHESSGGWMGTDGNDASSSAMDYAEENFAQSMAASGGLGLATLVSRGLQVPVRK